MLSDSGFDRLSFSQERWLLSLKDMGYLVSTHFLRAEPDVARLREGLPGSLDFRVYRHDTLALFAVDVYDEGAETDAPLCACPSAATVGTELGPELEPLSQAYVEARARRAAGSIRKSFIVTALMVSSALDAQVLSVCADDDVLDSALYTDRGKLTYFVALSDELNIVFENGGVTTYPATEERSIHQNAARAFERFLGLPAEAVGLGTFDPPEDYGFHSIVT